MSPPLPNPLPGDPQTNTHFETLESMQPPYDHHTRNPSYDKIKYHPITEDTQQPIFIQR